ncbi:toll-interacting protein B-like isoform X1 [Portunus trituberculatus]|uniref:toll-interacting protein B-like isoform X1 n=1 Tax=Portunus trituberculatus TaxID=210409 RepID=UPI001E1CBE20|nr:toll-interacting protein B-like isoform X1 [Portunus trituberculatus]XP_045121051.1 toll-interacting protein B-like isoform X1 [Portunus trituberculatus]XP_045121059.1 toll-interacting protein B-like isoform X1 [Portunus trituberculatus]XP_045121064.1 toll-interacting protein B-like isoform X1 [Portunus trituberculatus]XP_045121074.1 toll-interacting protein B-like isoform X1 [Portunus trituberculatus]XP_045121084.1 toll-interacting protein B-like isoform X1 [Portunus trituberculatus]XP_04
MFPLFIPIPIPLNFGSRRQSNYYIQHHVLHPNTGVMLGTLPNDFLRMPMTSAQTQEEVDHATALHLQHQMMTQPQQAVGRLQMTVVSAVLNKNYGMTRMDPYVRVRVGHYIYETQTDTNGAKTPRWNKVFQIYQFPKGVNTIHIEIYDERTLTDDELIAWVNLPIPETIFQGETVDEWYSLSGKMGEGQEGAINVVLSYTTAPALPHAFGQVMMVPPYAYGSEYTRVPVYTLPPNQQAPTCNQPQPRPISEEDLKQLEEMFPSVEAEVVKSVLEASHGNKEKAINSLLQMQDS